MMGLDHAAARDVELGESVLALDQFGARLLRATVSPARVASLIGELVGDRIRFGPVAVGPGGLVSATAEGRRGPVRACRVGEDPTLLRVRVPVALAVAARSWVPLGRFLVHAVVELTLRVTPTAPLAMTITVLEPAAEDVSLRLVIPPAMRALLTVAGDVETVLRGHVLRYAHETVSSERARRFTHIDLAELIERAWEWDLIAATAEQPEQSRCAARGSAAPGG
jgi:hypothetical protein